MSDAVESMFSLKLVPWHQKGVVLQEAPTSEEAIKQAGLDWLVVKKQLYINAPMASGVNLDGGLIMQDNFTAIQDRMALIRDKDNQLLTVVSEDYVPLQNSEAFSIFDPFVKDGTLTYETAASLTSGKRVFILARWNAGGVKIGDGKDEVRPYLLLVSGHDGATGVMVQPTSIRVVCQNTLSASMDTGYVITFRHRGDVKGKVDGAVKALTAMELEFRNLNEKYNSFVETQLNADEVWDLTNHLLFPSKGEHGVEALPREEEWEDNQVIPRWQLNLHYQRTKILELYERGLGSDFTSAKGTLWGWYNAVVEFVDWYAGKRCKDRTNYVLFGDGYDMKAQAYNLASQFTISRSLEPAQVIG